MPACRCVWERVHRNNSKHLSYTFLISSFTSPPVEGKQCIERRLSAIQSTWAPQEQLRLHLRRLRINNSHWTDGTCKRLVRTNTISFKCLKKPFQRNAFENTIVVLTFGILDFNKLFRKYFDPTVAFVTACVYMCVLGIFCFALRMNNWFEMELSADKQAQKIEGWMEMDLKDNYWIVYVFEVFLLREQRVFLTIECFQWPKM